MATIAEILSMSIEDRKRIYGVSNIDTHNNSPIGIETVIIDGNVFSDYGAFSFLWEKSYVKEPERSSSGAIENLNSYATFVTPHLKIDFSMMSIDSYRDIMTLLYEKNEHIVRCYDIIQKKFIEVNMYFATEELPKLWTIARALNGERWLELLGVQDYTVELIGTNSNFETLELTYELNKPEDAIWEGNTTSKIEFAKNTTVLMGEGAVSTIKAATEEESDKVYTYQDITFEDTYVFNGWNTKADGSGLNYINGDEYYFKENKILYAQWKNAQKE